MKLHKLFLAFLAFILLLSLPAYAHSGKTDGAGGHYDRFSGEYHYHHGYSAHQHPNGVCPYDYDEVEKTSTLETIVGIIIFGLLFGSIFGSIIIMFTIFYDIIKHNELLKNSVTEKIFPYVFKICIPLFLIISAIFILTD